MKYLTYTFALLVSLLVATTSYASVESQLSAYRVVTDDTGKTTFLAANKAKPDDIIEYRMHYRNNGDRTIRGLLPIGQIPVSTEYLPASDSTDVRARFTVSIDGGKTWDKEPVKRNRKTADGKTEEYIVPTSQYTHVRWTAKERLSVGETHEYRYRVKVK